MSVPLPRCPSHSPALWIGGGNEWWFFLKHNSIMLPFAIAGVGLQRSSDDLGVRSQHWKFQRKANCCLLVSSKPSFLSNQWHERELRMWSLSYTNLLKMQCYWQEIWHVLEKVVRTISRNKSSKSCRQCGRLGSCRGPFCGSDNWNSYQQGSSEWYLASLPTYDKKPSGCELKRMRLRRHRLWRLWTRICYVPSVAPLSVVCDRCYSLFTSSQSEVDDGTCRLVILHISADCWIVIGTSYLTSVLKAL